MNNTPRIIRCYGLDCQVCVPKDWTNAQIISLTEQENPCGTENGWMIRRKGDPALAGDLERVPCSDNPDWVHVKLDA